MVTIHVYMFTQGLNGFFFILSVKSLSTLQWLLLWNNLIQGLSLSIAPFLFQLLRKKQENTNVQKKNQKTKKGEKKQRTVAIDSCRRTSNPCQLQGEMERDQVWEVSLLQDSFQRCLSFLFSFCKKPPVVYKHFICPKFKENRNL